MTARASSFTTSQFLNFLPFLLVASCGDNFHLAEKTQAIRQAAPTASISALDVNALNVSSYSVSGNCSEDGTNNIQVTIQSVGPLTTNCTGGLWSITGINLSALVDGSGLNATVTITDGLGQTGSGTDLFNKDSTLPSVSVLLSPPITSASQSNFGVVRGSCSEVGREVVVEVGGITSANAPFLCVSDPTLTGACATVGTTPCWAATGFDLSSLGDGSTIITAEHSDAAGNSSTDDGLTLKDSSAPSITISADHITQSNQSAYNNDTYITGTCSELGTNNVSIMIATLGPFTTDCYDDGIHFTGVWTLSGIPAAANVSSLANGTGYIAAATISDSYGNSSLASDSFNKDTTLSVAPIAAINYSNMTSVSAGGTCGSAATHDTSMTLTVSRSAPSSSIDFPATCSSGTWSLTGLDISSLADDVALVFTISQNDKYGVPATANNNSNVLDVYPPMAMGNTSITDEHLLTDSAGNKYAIYTFTSTTLDLGNDINQNRITLTRSGIRDLAIAKYNSAGKLIGANAVQSNTGAGKIILKGAQLDPNDELIVIGEYDAGIGATAKEVLTGPGTTANYSLNNLGARDAFILKLNSDSTFNYIKTFNDAAGNAFFYSGDYWNPGAANYKNYDYIINFDSNKNAIFGVFYFGSSLNMSDAMTASSQVIMSSASDYAVFSLDEDGNTNFHLDFISTVGGVALLQNHAHDSYTQRVYVDVNDSIYVDWGVAGGASGTQVKDATGSTVATTVTHTNWMSNLAKFNQNGIFQWGASFKPEVGGTSHSGQVQVAPSGEIYISMEFGTGAVSNEHYDIYDFNGVLLKSIRKTADVAYDGSSHGSLIKFTASGTFEWATEFGYANQGTYDGLNPMRTLMLDSNQNPIVVGVGGPTLKAYRTSDVPSSLATNEHILDFASDYTGSIGTAFQLNKDTGELLWGKVVTSSNFNFANFAEAFQDSLGRLYLFAGINFGGVFRVYDVDSTVGVKTEIATRTTTGYNPLLLRFDNPNDSNTLQYIRMFRGIAPGASYGVLVSNTHIMPNGDVHIGVRSVYDVWHNSGFDVVDESNNVLGSVSATNISIDSALFKLNDSGNVTLSVGIKGNGVSGDNLLKRIAVDTTGHATKFIYSTSPVLIDTEINKNIPGDTLGRWTLIP